MGEKRQYADCTQFEVLPDCALQKDAPLLFLFLPIAVWDQPHRAAPSHFFEMSEKNVAFFGDSAALNTNVLFSTPSLRQNASQPARVSCGLPHAAWEALRLQAPRSES